MSVKKAPVKDSEVERRGKAIYKQLRKKLEAEHWGDVVVIDIYSGDYEVASNDLAASMQMFQRRPNALTWGERIGGGALYYLGEKISLVPPD